MEMAKIDGGSACPLVSIVVPVFNAAKWLSETLSSFDCQRYQRCEWILVDDGSTDSSLSIIERWQPRHGTSIVLRKENGGASSARNVGLRAASGDYVIFWDSDDSQNPEMLEKMVAAVLEGADLAICAIRRLDCDGRTREMFTCESQVVDSEDAIKRWFDCELSTGPYTKLIDRNLLLSRGIEFIEGETNEDIIWTAKILLAANSIALLGEPLYNYTSREQSVTNTLDERHLIVFTNARRLQALIAKDMPCLRQKCNEYCARQVLNISYLLLCKTSCMELRTIAPKVAKQYKQWMPEVAMLCKRPRDLAKRLLIGLYLRKAGSAGLLREKRV